MKIKRRVLRRLRKLPPGARADLLRVLTSRSNVRADVIRQFHERPGGKDMAEVLMDLEKDNLLREQVTLILRKLDTERWVAWFR
jgi:hypothetical protein